MLVPILGLALFVWTNKKPFEDFCNGLPITASSESVFNKVHAEKFEIVNKLNDSNGYLIVFNKKGPYFRYACRIEFINKKVVGSKFMSGD